MLQFSESDKGKNEAEYGASRTGRFASRILNMQNLPQNHLLDLDLAREIVKNGDEELLDTLFSSVPGTLSELIRTAFIPRDGCRFLVADFSAIEARVLAWLANEEWVLEKFRGKIYETTASRMFHIRGLKKRLSCMRSVSINCCPDADTGRCSSGDIC